MAKYLFIYHGGTAPKSEEETKKEMDAWGEWLEGMGAAVVDGGNPVGMSVTVNADGSRANNGGSNPASGYSLIEASDDDDAVEKARGCPHLASGGTIELAPTFDM